MVRRVRAVIIYRLYIYISQKLISPNFQLRGVPLNDCTIRSRGKIMRHRQMAILIGGCYDDGSAFERGLADRRHMRLTDRSRSAMVEKREQPKVTILWAQRDLRLAKHLHIYG